jgi:AraC family transcriptional regulator
MSKAPQIVHFTETRVAELQHRGDPRRLGATIRKFIEWRKQNGLSPHVSDTFNIFYDDEVFTDPSSYRLGLCAAIEQDVEPNSFGVVSRTIPGGRCAILRHVGSEHTLGASIAYLCSEWLTDSGETASDDFPLFCHRVEFFPDVPEDEAVTDLYLPLK